MASGEPRPTAPELGSVLDGKYRLVRELAAGAMGRLVEAEHLVLERPVAIKLLSSTPDARSRRRMVQEARAAQQLSNEHIVRVFDVGLVGDCPYIVMELLEGADLGSLVEQSGPLSVRDAVDYVLQACVGLAEAHACDVIHRDIKPSNLFLSRTTSGTRLVKVVDFGISKVGDGTGDDRATSERTADNSLLGSPYYMSPEQLRNPTRVDARTDVWSLGVTLFHLLSGAHPFEGETVNEVSAAIFTEPPKDLSALRDDVPEELRHVIARALAKRPDERTSSVIELGQSLAPFGSALGRLAAERLAARQAPPSRSEPEAVVVRSAELTGTAKLATTLPALSSDKTPAAPHAAERALAPRRRSGAGVLLAAAAGIAAVALLAWWARSPGGEPVSPAAASSSTRAPAPTVPPAPVPTPAASSVAAADAAAAPPPPPAPRPRRATRPPPTPPLPKAPPPPGLDIDGVPIVE